MKTKNNQIRHSETNEIINLTALEIPPLPSLNDRPVAEFPAWLIEAESHDDRMIVDLYGTEFPDPNHVDQSVRDVCKAHGHTTEDFRYLRNDNDEDGIETCTRCGRIVNCDADGFDI